MLLRDSSLSARRAWIEIPNIIVSLYGFTSLSARRAWIEISKIVSSLELKESLSARRAWIEISVDRVQRRNWPGRSPQGERG